MLAANEHTINLINKANEPHHDKEHVNYGSAKFWISGQKHPERLNTRDASTK